MFRSAGLLGSIAEGGAKSAAAPVKPAAPAQEAAKPAEAPKPAATADLDRSGPAARKIVAERDLDPATIAATGKDGRITKGDALQATPAPGPPRRRRPSPPRSRLATIPMPIASSAVRMTRLRKRVAERLKTAQNNAAMLTTFNEVDMTAILALRETYRDSFEKKHGVKLGFMSFFLKASIAALKELPAVNAEIDGDDIVYKNYYDIGVAVGTENGLVVPVVRDADKLGFADIEKTIGAFGRKGARRQAHAGGAVGGHLHHLERRGLRLAALDADPQPAAIGDPRHAQDPEACGGDR